MRPVFCVFGLLASILCVNAISELSIKGNKFFNAEGRQVYFKGSIATIVRDYANVVGVAYQRSPKDPFVNVTQCLLDATLMKTLGANVIRGIVPLFPSSHGLYMMNSVPC